MQATKIIESNFDINNRLELFDVTKSELLEVVHKVVMARNDSVSIDPASASGLFAYIYGTRGIRELFMKKGWKPDRSENIESVWNKDNGIKIVYQSSDSASELNRTPRAISDKGEGSKRMVASGQMDLEMFLNKDEAAIVLNQKIWFLYVSVNGSDVCAELSCPGSIENGQFIDFVERIFILKSGEWDSINIVHNSDGYDIETEEFEINVSRK